MLKPMLTEGEFMIQFTLNCLVSNLIGQSRCIFAEMIREIAPFYKNAMLGKLCVALYIDFSEANMYTCDC